MILYKMHRSVAAYSIEIHINNQWHDSFLILFLYRTSELYIYINKLVTLTSN